MISNITPSLLANFRVNMGLVREPFVKTTFSPSINPRKSVNVCCTTYRVLSPPPRFFASFGNLCLLWRRNDRETYIVAVLKYVCTERDYIPNWNLKFLQTNLIRNNNQLSSQNPMESNRTSIQNKNCLKRCTALNSKQNKKFSSNPYIWWFTIHHFTVIVIVKWWQGDSFHCHCHCQCPCYFHRHCQCPCYFHCHCQCHC